MSELRTSGVPNHGLIPKRIATESFHKIVPHLALVLNLDELTQRCEIGIEYFKLVFLDSEFSYVEVASVGHGIHLLHLSGLRSDSERVH